MYFFSRCYLRVHEPVHLQLKPFKCRVCGMAFNAASNRSTHMRKAHPEEFARAKAERESGLFVPEESLQNVWKTDVKYAFSVYIRSLLNIIYILSWYPFT